MYKLLEECKMFATVIIGGNELIYDIFFFF